MTTARPPVRVAWSRVLLLCGWVWLLGCRPANQGLGEGPPNVDANTQVLGVFEPASLTGPAPAGSDLQASFAGPPQPPAAPALPAPMVLDYGPTGEASEYPTIQVRFNRPMVAFGEKQRTTAAEAGFRIDPPIAGEAYWAEPTRLVFEPAEALPLATEYRVSIDREIQAVDGPALDVNLNFGFGTQAPTVDMFTEYEASMAMGGSSHWKAKVGLSGSHEFTLTELRNHLRVEARSARGDLVPVEFKLTAVKRDRDGYRYPDFWIAPATRWPADSEVIVTVDAKLRGKVGPRPVGYPTAHSFRTPAGVEFVAQSCVEGEYADGCELGPVFLQFSAPISRAQARHVSISPKPAGFDALAWDRVYDDSGRERDAYAGILAWGDFQLGEHYTITIGEQLRDVHGQPLVGVAATEVEFIEPPPSLSLERSQGTFVRSLGAKLGIETRHVEALDLRVAVLDDATLEQLLESDVERIPWPSQVTGQRSKIPLTHTGKFGWSSHELELGQFTTGKPGAMIVEVATGSLLARAQGRATPPVQRGLVQITDLGITAVGSLPKGVVRVAQLSDDKPVAEAEIELVLTPGGDRRTLGKTDADGLLALPGTTKLTDRALLRARKGDDQVVLEIGELWAGAEPTGPLRSGESVRASVMTERPLYKPGEWVRVMGWTSIATPHELSGLRKVPNKTLVSIEIRDYRDELVAETKVRIKEHGKFWATLQLPAVGALGGYKATVRLLGQPFEANFQVKDFPVPAFEVTAESSKADIHSGESTTISVNASYYFGGRVPITRVRTTNDCREVDYRPPGLDPNFSSAPKLDYWRSYGRMGQPLIQIPPGPGGAKGHVEYDISLWTGHEGQTNQCTASVAIADISEQEIGAESTIWVHPEFYLAAHTPYMLADGDPAEIAIQTLDYDGSAHAVAGVEVELTRHWSEPEYVTERGKRQFAGWRSRTETLPTCKVDSDGATSCKFAKLEHGSYDVVVTAKRGEYAPTIHSWIWVSPPERSMWPSTPVDRLSVVFDQDKPIPGQTVRAKISAPWRSGVGVALLAKGGVHEVHSFVLAQGQAEIPLEVTDAWIPGVEVHVLAVEPGTKLVTTKLQTAYASATVADESRRLAVSVRVQSEAQTRESIPIEIEVRDPSGKPVRGHVSVWAVDEAVLSLAPLVLPDFVSAFVVGFGGAIEVLSGYPALMLPFASGPDLYEPRVFDRNWTGHGYGMGYGTGAGYGAGGGGSFGGVGVGSVGGQLPKSRGKFDSAPIFIADAELDERGIAKLRGDLPDNLTTFRLTAVASSPLAAGGKDSVEARFGTGDARVRVTRPMVVRAAMPRVMRPGDLAEVGVIVDNLRGGAGTVDVNFTIHDGDGVIELIDPAAAHASIEAGGQLRLPFRVRALTTGTPEIEVSAVMRSRSAGGNVEQVGGQPLADGLRLPLPIEPERTLTDRVAVYGSLADDGAALLPFVLPRDADPKFGGLSVSVGSTLLGGLEDSVAYLVNYPHGCLEQTSSSLLPLIPLGRLAENYPLGIPDVDMYVASGITRLRSMQLASGGFSYWPGGTEPAPYASAYATWVLAQAQAAGYPVPAAMLDGADRYVLEEIAKWQAVTGPTVGQDIETALMLVALADRKLAPLGALDILYSRRQRLPVFSQAMLLIALEAIVEPSDPRLAELTRELMSVVDEREAVAKVEVTQRWTWYWDSSARSSAMVLIALLRVDPDHPLVSKLTRGLLEIRRGGRWGNTQENAYGLVALADYAAVYEAEDPRFDGRVWLGNTALATVHVDGRSFAFEDAFTPMVDLIAAADQADERLILERAGEGRMYYRVGLEWATTATDKPAKAEGITIQRHLRNVDGVVEEDQSIASGDLLAFDLIIEVPAALDHVVIEVPLPAGLEAVDVELGRGSKAMNLYGSRAWWVSHQELRRDRAVLFADHLEPGVHVTAVPLRATTPGEYVMPAARAEQMYYPEVYGRTTGRRLVVR